MSSPDLSSAGRSVRSILPTLIWPAGLLFAAILWGVFSLILWTSESVNEIASERERAQFGSAIAQHLDSLRARLPDMVPFSVAASERNDAAARATRARFQAELLALDSFDGVAVVAADGKLIAGTFDGFPMAPGALGRLRTLAQPAAATLAERVRRRAATDPGGDLRSETVSLVLHDGVEIYAAFAKPMLMRTDDVGDVVATGHLVAVKYIDIKALKLIANFHDLTHFQISAEPRREPDLSIRIPGLNPGTSAYLTWTPNRPGDVVRAELIPFTLFGFAVAVVLFGLIAVHVQRMAVGLAETEKRSRDLLSRDPLSGLVNRVIFGERLSNELGLVTSGGRSLSVLFIDLDRFKDVNDTYGHQAGDKLIQLVAQRLSNLVRAKDTIARFGGDEFAVIQTDLRSREDAAALARRILDALTQPFTLPQGEVVVGASIGVAIAPEDGRGGEDLMGLADAALYQAKSEGRNRYVFFQKRMVEAMRMKKIVEEELRRAIEHDELVLHYQPLVSADGETIVSLEALVRWPHPTRGMIPPGEFISIAEERGLVTHLGEWVLRQACRDGRRWPGLRVAVNVSPVQFRHRDFVGTVTSVLRETGFPASCLELELTEGVVVEDADAAETAIRELRSFGIHLALDDFGTGYSSLIYLRRFAFDTIKIDRSFLESMEATGESAILVHSMVHLGRALGLTVTAEGVETREQHRFLQALGCHQLQGFLFSRPVPADEIERLLARGGPIASAA